MSLGSAPNLKDVIWDQKKPCAVKYIDKMRHDGSFIALSELKKEKVVDDVLLFYESNRAPGHADWGRGIKGYVCPHIDWVRQFIDDETVIYVRGGFKGWYDFLTSYKNSNWLMCYNANTGRERWNFWDLILWDLGEVNHVDKHGRLWYYYKKPIDESVFHYIKESTIFDVCIGSSHIHDKKGQWRGIDALIEYKRKYKKNLKAVLPGFGNKGVKTSQIITKIHDYDLDVTVTGMLDKPALSKTVLNRSKLGLFLGTHGQGDRGPIEALATGMPLIIGSERYHSPSVCDSRVSLVVNDLDNPEHIAECINYCLRELPSRHEVLWYYRKYLSFRNVCYPNIKRVFEFLKNNPLPTPEAKLSFVEMCAGVK
jgi:hypothetical protein